VLCTTDIANSDENPPAESLTMNRGLIYIGMTIGGCVGWWVGDYIGFGLMGCFLVSSVGSLAGMYLAWRVMEEYLG